jgi:peptide/nickel transport system substrate-binding protein
MRRRTLLGAAAATPLLPLARPAIAQAKAKTLRFVPQAALANPDPIWTTATVAANSGYMIWDTLYGIDDKLVSHPQMCAGSETSSDEKTWTFTLRDGLSFHDGEPVRAIDCTTSIDRWSKKDPFGQKLMSVTDELKPLDDKRFQFRLKSPFRQMLYALGAGGCFVMPERMAKTPATQQVTEYIGSGPFVFKRDEWVSGASSVWTKNEKYVPRQEPPQFWSGGKVVNFDRVEWTVMDPSTTPGALQRNEVDWWENPLIDLLPLLKSDKNVTVEAFDPFGALAIIAFNHLYPPFDNPAVLRALLPALNQREYVEAVVGEQMDLAKLPAGFFTVGTPMANMAGMDVLTSPRDVDKAKAALAAAGYKGEKVILMSPSDQAQLVAMAQVTRDLFLKIGLNVDYQSMDWGTLVSRRAKQDPPDQGGWNAFCTTWGGLQVSNPGSSYPLQGVGKSGWFGWTTDPKLVQLREDWFNAPDVPAQKKVCEQIQVEAFQSIPFMPCGQWVTPTAYRKDLTGFVKCSQILFWGVKRT